MSRTYSMLMPYHHRPDHLYNTFLSFRHWYKDRGGFEVVIVECPGSREIDNAPESLREVIADFPDIPTKLIEAPNRGISSAHNMAAAVSEGEYLLFNGPEIFHFRDELSAFDAYFDKHPDHYAVGSCFNARMPGRKTSFDTVGFRLLSWYQHGKVNNRLLHFCSAISKDLYYKVGGFCTEYDAGASYEDDDWREEVRRFGIPVVPLDTVEAIHQQHANVPRQKIMALVERNHQIYQRRCRERSNAVV